MLLKFPLGSESDMLKYLKSKSALLNEIAELRVENGMVKAAFAAQSADVAALSQEMRDCSALLKQAYAQLAATAKAPRRDERGKFAKAGQ